MKQSTKNLITDLCYEIKSLRKTNEKMGLRLGVFDDMMSVLRGHPEYPREGAAECIVSRAERHLELEENCGS